MTQTTIQIRFNDCDMGGHVHNAAYLHYFETGRIHFFQQSLGKEWNWKKEGLILRKNTVEYHLPTYLEDQITIHVGCNHIGDKSFTLFYEVRNQDKILKTSGESLVVCFDYMEQKTISIPEKIREALNKHFVE